MEKNWRISKTEYRESKRTINHNTDWMSWSMKQQSEKDIFLHTLLECDPGNKEHVYICFAYVSKHHLSMELLKDMLFIQSGFFNYDDWNLTDQAVDQALEILLLDDQMKMIKAIAESEIPAADNVILMECKCVWNSYLNDIDTKTDELKDILRVLISKAERLLERSDDRDYAGIGESVKELIEGAKYMATTMKSIYNTSDSYVVQDRMDWHVIRPNNELPKEFVERMKPLKNLNHGKKAILHIGN